MASAASDKDEELLTNATLRAGSGLGLTRADIGAVVGVDLSVLKGGVLPETEARERALLLIQLYRSLYALVGGNEAAMRHWMATANHHIGGVPQVQIRTASGLAEVVNYLGYIRRQ